MHTSAFRVMFQIITSGSNSFNTKTVKQTTGYIFQLQQDLYLCRPVAYRCTRATSAFLHIAVHWLLSLNWRLYEHRYEQTDVISDLNHECKKRKLRVICTVLQTRNHNNMTLHIRFLSHWTTAAAASHQPFPCRYKILPWNSTKDGRNFTIITEYLVSIPNTTKGEHNKNISENSLSDWQCSNVVQWPEETEVTSTLPVAADCTHRKSANIRYRMVCFPFACLRIWRLKI